MDNTADEELEANTDPGDAPIEGRHFEGEQKLRGKLVRDLIPDIIRQDNLTPIIEQAPPAEFEERLVAKLREEVEEFAASGEVEELVDVMEVCFAAAARRGVTPEVLEELTRDKRERRGGFGRRLVWLGNTEETELLGYEKERA